MKKFNGTDYDGLLPLAYNALSSENSKLLEGKSFDDIILYTKTFLLPEKATIAIGNYFGTGTYGPSHPTEINVGFKPSVIFFNSTPLYSSSNIWAGRSYAIFSWLNQLQIVSTQYQQIKCYYNMTSTGIKMNSQYDTVYDTVYQTASAIGQFNNSGQEYKYIAIGGQDKSDVYLITSSRTFVVPYTGKYYLELYGGGGRSMGQAYTGGSSCQTYDSIVLSEGQQIKIIIGVGGLGNQNGTSTIFGNYSVAGGDGAEQDPRKGAGNKGTNGINAYNQNNYSNGTKPFSQLYGYGTPAHRGGYGTGGPRAVYLRYLGT